jgi:hypothetical protein
MTVLVNTSVTVDFYGGSSIIECLEAVVSRYVASYDTCRLASSVANDDSKAYVARTCFCFVLTR